jgi:hypothetical protein
MLGNEFRYQYTRMRARVMGFYSGGCVRTISLEGRAACAANDRAIAREKRAYR